MKRLWPSCVAGTVELTDPGITHRYITSKLVVTCAGVTREVAHFWFDTWPDHGVPKRTETVVNMLDACRECAHDPHQVCARGWVSGCC